MASDQKKKYPEAPITHIISPFFRTPLTDLTGGLVNAQHHDKCGPMEMQMQECLEAYGLPSGVTKCDDIIRDYQECFSMRKQEMRTFAMRMERQRQWKNGELKENFQQPGPRVDSM